MRPSLLDPLFAPITSLDGIGPKVAALIEKVVPADLGDRSARVGDLLFTLPHSVIDRRNRPGIAGVLGDISRERLLNGRGRRLAIAIAWLRSIRGRHPASAEHADDLFPVLESAAQVGGGCHLREVHAGLGQVAAVAIEAILAHERRGPGGQRRFRGLMAGYLQLFTRVKYAGSTLRDRLPIPFLPRAREQQPPPAWNLATITRACSEVAANRHLDARSKALVMTSRDASVARSAWPSSASCGSCSATAARSP